MSLRRRLLGLVFAAATLAGPAIGAAEPLWGNKPPPSSVAYVTLPTRLEVDAPVKSYAELRFRGIVRQTLDLSCGAAALATLLHGYFGLPVDEQGVIRGIFATATPDDAKQISAAGFSMLELKKYAESQGLVAGGFKTDKPQDLRKLRAPVVALVSSRGYKHFVVVRHVRNDEVAIADPVFGNRIETLESFTKRWNGVILVTVYPGHKVNAAFMESPPGAQDPRAVQLLMSRAYSPAITYGYGDFY
jgi:predicted double-glycine peptidase